MSTDGLVFVIEPEQHELRVAFEHARSRPLSDSCSRTAIIAPTGFDTAAELGVADVPVASGHRAAMDALQAVVKPLLLDLVEQVG